MLGLDILEQKKMGDSSLYRVISPTHQSLYGKGVKKKIKNGQNGTQHGESCKHDGCHFDEAYLMWVSLYLCQKVKMAAVSS